MHDEIRISEIENPKKRRRAAQELIGRYHDEQLRMLLERVRNGFQRLDAGDIDPFDLDDLIHHYKRSAQKLWSFCNSGGSGGEHAARALEWNRGHNEQNPDCGNSAGHDASPASGGCRSSATDRRRHAKLPADPPSRRRLDLAMPPHGRALTRVRVLPQFVLRRLAHKPPAVSGEVPLELALLHAAISTDSTNAHPLGGIASPRASRSSRTRPIASRTISRAWSSDFPWV